MSESVAVVIGGSIAGLLASAALVRTFDRVIVVERDRLSDGEEFRPGVPQARHAHLFLLRGATAMEELVPGVRQELTDAGAPRFDLGEGVRLSNRGFVTPAQRYGESTQVFSRNLLETRLRARATAPAAVTVRDGTTVTGLCVSTPGGRVVGVTTESGGTTGTIEADLVVDTSGRTSRADRWLQKLGYPVPRDLVVDAGQSYATAWLSSIKDRTDFRGFLYELGLKIPEGRGAGFVTIEGDQAHLVLFGRGRCRPSTLPEEFVSQVEQLGSPLLTEMARAVDRQTPIHPYGRLLNRRRQYHRMRRWPRGFLVAGDALCVLNPIYAQGMTVAALQASYLRETAAGILRDPARTQDVQRGLARQTVLPWLMATAQDGTWSEQPPPYARTVDKFLTRMINLAPQSPQLHRALLQALQLVVPTALADPSAVRALLRPGHG